MQLPQPITTARLNLWLFLAGFATFALHEAAHFATGWALGYDMTARLNGVSSLTPALLTHKAIIDAAGPLATIAQAIVAFILLRHYKLNVAFAFLYFAAFMRVLATGVSTFNLNDEARLSLYLGIGTWTVPIMVSAGLLLLAWRGSRVLALTWKQHIWCYVTASISVSLVVGLDRLLF
jgi:hypothetical protein